MLKQMMSQRCTMFGYLVLISVRINCDDFTSSFTSLFFFHREDISSNVLYWLFKHLARISNYLLRVVFQLLFRCLNNPMRHCLLCLIYVCYLNRLETGVILDGGLPALNLNVPRGGPTLSHVNTLDMFESPAMDKLRHIEHILLGYYGKLKVGELVTLLRGLTLLHI